MATFTIPFLTHYREEGYLRTSLFLGDTEDEGRFNFSFFPTRRKSVYGSTHTHYIKHLWDVEKRPVKMPPHLQRCRHHTNRRRTQSGMRAYSRRDNLTRLRDNFDCLSSGRPRLTTIAMLDEALWCFQVAGQKTARWLPTVKTVSSAEVLIVNKSGRSDDQQINTCDFPTHLHAIHELTVMNRISPLWVSETIIL